MLCVIGDIHGCYNTLDALVKKIKDKYSSIPLYSVGDLVDRGKFTFETIELIMSEGIKFTSGNHEHMFLSYVRNPVSNMGKAWLYNDYESTLDSYIDHEDKMIEHLKFLEKAPLFYDLKDCFISHAGVSVYYKDQFPENYKDDISVIYDTISRDYENGQGILWTRDRLLDLGKLQVVGHTHRKDIKHNKDNNSIYIDTSVYTGNKLSAVVIENNYVVDTLAVPTFREDIY